MAIIKQVYTLTPSWSASGLADLFRSAFIDAGLMADWHASFLSAAVENRILQVVFDPARTYGTTYYWFMFTTSGVYVHTAGQWAAGATVPSGSQYQDYFATTTNAVTNHFTLLALSSSTSVTLTRYTSQQKAGCTFFVLAQGAAVRAPFLIPTPAFGPNGFVSLDHVLYNGLIRASSNRSNNAARIAFEHIGGHLRTTYLGATALRGGTNAGSYYTLVELQLYIAPATISSSAAFSGNMGSIGEAGIYLPTAMAVTHSGLAADHLPVFTGPCIGAYLQPLPDEFALIPYHASAAPMAGDRIIVSAGVEEWEILQFDTSSTANHSQLFFAARVV